MKNWTLLFILIWAALGAQAQGHKIDVKLKGFTGDTLTLAYHMASKQYTQDTVYRQGNKFVFEGDSLLKPGIYLVVLPPDNNFFELMIPSDDQVFSVQTDVDDLSKNMKVTGSEENRLFYESINEVNRLSAGIPPLQAQLKEATDDAEKQQLQTLINKEYETINASREAFMDAHPDLLYTKVLKLIKEPVVPEAPEGADEGWRYRYYKKHYFDNTDFSEAGLIRTPMFRNRLIRYMEKVANPHWDSLKFEATRLVEYARADKEVFQYVTIELINYYAKSKIMCHDAVYVHLVDMVYRVGDAWWADEKQVDKMTDRVSRLRYTMCGVTAPDVVMKDTDGKTQALRLVDKEYTVLYFWDYDCGHCKKVTPKLAEWFGTKANHDKVGLMTVSINGDIEKWKERLGEYGLDTLPAINVQDHARKTNFGYYYDMQSTPRALLLDKDKHIIAKQISIETLEEILTRMLKDDEDTKGKK